MSQHNPEKMTRRTPRPPMTMQERDRRSKRHEWQRADKRAIAYA